MCGEDFVADREDVEFAGRHWKKGKVESEEWIVKKGRVDSLLPAPFRLLPTPRLIDSQLIKNCLFEVNVADTCQLEKIKGDVG